MCRKVALEEHANSAARLQPPKGQPFPGLLKSTSPRIRHRSRPGQLSRSVGDPMQAPPVQSPLLPPQTNPMWSRCPACPSFPPSFRATPPWADCKLLGESDFSSHCPVLGVGSHFGAGEGTGTRTGGGGEAPTLLMSSSRPPCFSFSCRKALPPEDEQAGGVGGGGEKQTEP